MQPNIIIDRANNTINKKKSGTIFVKLFKNGPNDRVNLIDHITLAHKKNMPIANEI